MRRSRLLAVATAGALLLSGCGFSGLYNVSLPGGTNLGNHPYTVHIDFADVLDLVPQANVKVNDVAVGKVTKIELDNDPSLGARKGWIARVTIQVRGNVDLPANARADVRMTSLLGEKYIDLEQPLDTPSAGRLKDQDTIPLARTGSAPEVEEVLSALELLLNGGGLAQIQTITSELNKAFKGNESSIHDLIGQLGTFVSGLDSQKDVITTALSNLAKLSITLNNQKQVLANALDTFPQALAVLNANRDKLVQLLSSLSNLGAVAGRVVQETETGLVSSLKSLEPVLVRLTEAGTDLPNAFKLLITYPFPIGDTLKFVKGDYANLNAFLDLNLNDNLCGISSLLCSLVGTSASPPKGQSANSTALKPQSSGTPLAIPGLGG